MTYLRSRAVLAVLAVAVGGGSFFGCGAEADAPSERAASELPEALKARATAHVVVAARDGIAARWAGASLGRVEALYRPDVDGPAYYEVQVRAKDGAPAGYVVLSTADHDFPIVHFDDSGTPPTVRARAFAAKLGVDVTRVLRVGSDYYAEGIDGGIVGVDGRVERDALLAVPPELAQYREEMKAEAAATWRALVDEERAAREPASPQLTSVRPLDQHYLDGDALDRCAPFAYDAAQYLACTNTPAPDANCWTVGEMPHYRQLAPGEGQNTNWFKSGCGPTAWAVLVGWASRRGFEGDPDWTPFRMLYRADGLTQPLSNSPVIEAPLWWGGGNVPPPPNEDLFYFHGPWALERLTMAINDKIGTFGNPTTNGGATLPSSMANFNDYLRDVGIPADSMNVSDDTIGGAHTDAIKRSAIRYLCTYETPVIVGIDDLRHYPIVDHYYKRGGTEYYWTNQNSPSYWDVGWIAKSFFYAGTIIGKKAPPGIHVLNATYGAGAIGQPWGNAQVKLVASCEGKTTCTFSIDPFKLALPPATTFDAAYKCGADTTIQRVSWASDTGAGTVTLSCKKGTGTFSDPPPIPPGNATLTVQPTGHGRVTGTGIDCGAQCSATYLRGTQVTLTPIPDAGETFLGWTGGVCYGTGPCTVTMDFDKTVRPVFSSPPQTLSVAVSGSGRVTASPAGIDCPATCASAYPLGSAVTLTALPDPGWVFTGWSGACTGAFCTLTMSAPQSVTATFAPAGATQYTLTVIVDQGGAWPPGAGDVTSMPAGLSCHLGGDQVSVTCSASFPAGGIVTLQPTPAYAVAFVGFTGACSGATCAVTMDGDKLVTATFLGQVP